MKNVCYDFPQLTVIYLNFFFFFFFNRKSKPKENKKILDSGCLKNSEKG